MRNRFIAGKLKRRWTVWDVGYCKSSGKTLSRKPRTKSCGFVAEGFWQSCGPQSQIPAEPGTGTRGGQCNHHSLHPGQDRASLRCFGSHAPTPRSYPRGTCTVLGGDCSHCCPWQQSSRKKSLTLFSSFLLKSLRPHKALSHTWFLQFLLHKTQHNNKIKQGYGEQWVQQINGQAQPSSAFIAISPEEHSLPWRLWNEPQQSLDLAGSWQTCTFLSQLNPVDLPSGCAHVNLIIIIKVLLAQQCKPQIQCINLVKITVRSQVRERAGGSFFISLSLKTGGGGCGQGRRLQLSQQCWVITKRISSLSSHPSKTTHNFLKTPWKYRPPTQLIDWNSFPLKTTRFGSTMAYSKRVGGKKYYSVQDSRKGYTQQTRTPIFTIATSLFIIWPTCIKEQPQEAKCKSSGTFKH